MFGAGGLSDSGAQDVKPVPIKRAVPQYPFELRQANITGKVIVEFVVTTKGDVANAFAVRSTHPDFEPAAIASVSGWKFKPGSHRGEKVNTRMQIPIIFKLDGVSGPQIFRALEGESLDKLPDEMRYDRPPKNMEIQPGVYPYESLLNNERKVVLGGALISALGTVDSVLWKTESISDDLKQATMAMLNTAKLEPATRNKKPVATMMWFRLKFDPLNGDVRITDSAAAILKKLRLEGENAQFTKSRELDAKIRPLRRQKPMFPRLAQANADTGNALIEVYIDQEGQAQLSRIVSSSELAFGYAAAQAIVQWQFEPPLKDGKPVVVKVRVPVNFKRE
jgi:TonB family protein